MLFFTNIPMFCNVCIINIGVKLEPTRCIVCYIPRHRNMRIYIVFVIDRKEVFCYRFVQNKRVILIAQSAK